MNNEDRDSVMEAVARILRTRFPYVKMQEANRAVTVHWFDVVRAVEMAAAMPAASEGDRLDWDGQAQYDQSTYRDLTSTPSDQEKLADVAEALLDRSQNFMDGVLRVSGTPEYRALRALITRARQTKGEGK